MSVSVVTEADSTPAGVEWTEVTSVDVDCRGLLKAEAEDSMSFFFTLGPFTLNRSRQTSPES